MPDKEKTCIECGQPFVWAEREQEFFKANGLSNEPKRCAPCRAKRRAKKAKEMRPEPPKNQDQD